MADLPVLPRLPDWVPPVPSYVPPSSSLSRPSATQINAAATKQQDITLSLPGYNETIPLVYGEDRMAGLWLVAPYTHIPTGELRFAIAWSWGGEEGIEGVQQIYMNGADLPVSVLVTHYYGTPDQGPDPTLDADLAGFNDSYPYLAYTVFRVPPGAVQGFPQTHQIEALIRGIRVRDPRLPPPAVPSGRYFRISVTEASTDSIFLNIAEIEIRATIGGANQTGSGTASTSSVASDPLFSPGAAFDSDPATMYSSDNPSSGPVWLKYDFGAPVDMAQIVISSGDTSLRATRAPRTFTVEVSDDDVTWVAVGGATGLAAWGITESRTFALQTAGNIVYTANTALCMADFIERPESIGGMGSTAYNVIACADMCDEIVQGEPRCRIGLTIKHADYADSMLGMWANYAEVLWQYDQGGILMVPDAPVLAPVKVFTTQDIVEGSLQLLGNDLRQSPTSVTVNVRIPSGSAASWRQAAAPQYLPGVEEGLVDNLPSDLDMPGLHRDSEGGRKALRRLRRLSYPSRFAFQTFDEGIAYQRGDVVQMPDTRGMISRQVRILSVEQVAPGRYQNTCEHYSDDLYPDDFPPSETALWPPGTGFFWQGASAPAGWEFNTDADGYLLHGESGTRPAGTISGDGNIVYAPGVTSSDGAHGAPPGDGSWKRPPDGGVTGAQIPTYFGNEPPHFHAYTQGGVISYVPAYRRERVIVKTSAGFGEMPALAHCFGDGQVISTVLTEVTDYINRLVGSGAPGSGGFSRVFNTADRAAFSVLRPVFAGAGAHGHTGGTAPADPGPFFGPFPQAWNHAAVGNHTHSAQLDFELNHKRATLAVFAASQDARAQQGLIALFFGDPLDLDATGFNLCDGTKGTIDLSDRFIVRAPSASAGQLLGDDTFTFAGTTNTYTHNHKGSRSDMQNRPANHQSDVAHNHTVSGSGTYRPEGFAVRFIQYTGVL